MDQPLLTMLLRTPVDLVRARQRARQVARMLGFTVLDRAALAAAVQALAEHQAGRGFPFTLTFQLRRRQLEVTGTRGQESSLRLCRDLPDPAPVLAAEDLAWIATKLDHLTPIDLVEEIQQLNRELLATLHELHAADMPQIFRDEESAAAA
jgi:hypothetical protein